MKHKATATIILQVEAIFEDDGFHAIPVQAASALEADAEWKYCMRPGEVKLTDIEIQPIA